MATSRPDRQPNPLARGLASRGRTAVARVGGAWRLLDADQRLAAVCALGLFVTMLLPWYTKTEFVVSGSGAKVGSVSLSAFQAFSFVEAAVLLVSAGVLGMLFARAEGRAFHLPGGDGTIIMVAGAWAAILIFYRLLDKPGLQGAQRITASVGVTWGIFLALLTAIGLAVAGARVRAARRPEPPLVRPSERERERQQRARRGAPGGAAPDQAATQAAAATVPTAANREPRPDAERAAASSSVPAEGPSSRPRFPPAPPASASRRRIVTREDAAQLSFEDASATEAFGEEPPARPPGGEPPPGRRRRG
jgi:hypothetical protein